MQTAIAIVRLAPGQVGYYDELSRVHLTMSRPKATIYDYMNTSAILRSIKNRTLILDSGTLNPVFKESSIDETIIIDKVEPLEIPEVMEQEKVEEEVKETKTTKKEKTTASKAKQSKKREE